MKFLTAILVYFSAGIFLTSAYTQSLVEDANVATSPDVSGENVFTEQIKIISQSKKIFILTNNNQKLSVGDFISLALNNDLAARAVVAKNHQGQTGIKIIKIYSLQQWGKLRRGMDVQVVRGDDSMFGKKVVVEPTATTPKIRDEDDLYTGDVVVEDELGDFEDNKNRHIKPDNVVGVFASFNYADNIDAVGGGKTRANQYGLSWAYQFADNFFAEGVYGYAMYSGYPNDDLKTATNTYIGRLKYNIKGPLYTFFMPYIGYRAVQANSPDAGKSGGTGNNAGVLDQESEAIRKLRKNGPVAGVTILRRLVPGWFVRGDVGTDLISLGFSIEF